MLRMQKNVSRSETHLGVWAYDSKEWRLVNIGRGMEYEWGVKSETIKLERIVLLRCSWTSFLSDEMLGCTIRVNQEYARRVSGYDTSTRYPLDCLSIPRWLDIQSWICLRRVEKFTAILLCNWLKISQYGCFIEYPKSFRDCSIQCPSNSYASTNLNQTWRFTRTWKNGSRSQKLLVQFHTNNIQWKCAALTDSHKRIYGTAEFDLVHHQIGAPAFYDILVYPIQAMIQFTRCLFSIDFISYSSQ
jgi:hypothetical protein